MSFIRIKESNSPHSDKSSVLVNASLNKPYKVKHRVNLDLIHESQSFLESQESLTCQEITTVLENTIVTAVFTKAR
jgi:hypothetical protein